MYERTTTIKSKNITKLVGLKKMLDKFTGEKDEIIEDYINDQLIIKTVVRKERGLGILGACIKGVGLNAEITHEPLEKAQAKDKKRRRE